MIKINPITKSLFSSIKPITFTKETLKTTVPLVLAAPVAAATYPMIFSNNFKEYDKSINEDNYFQLKTNPKTGKPYEADVFQKTAANYLFNNNAVVVTAPTGTGKTAIAEYVMTKNLKEGKKTYYTTPLKALSN